MAHPAFIAALQHASAYPHACDAIELIETHISWVLLTGAFVYKIKKPVDFGFLNFSTLERRRHCCEEELRLNRRYAPSLYLDVVTITRAQGVIRVGGVGEVIDHAVRMHQFDGAMQLDRRLADGALTPAAMIQFADTLAQVHAALPRSDLSREFGTPVAVWAPVEENFVQVAASVVARELASEVREVRQWSEQQHAALSPLMRLRRDNGFVRECHGDLHLANLVALADGVHAFDCIEFSEALRWIDVVSDVAFLVMDCLVRARTDLAYTFLNRYLEVTGDYAGCALLGYYLVYRSMVRAKVAALQAGQASTGNSRQRYAAHVKFAHTRARRRGAILLMCGLSGSGKSWLAQRLVPTLGALCIRSDLERKRLAGLPADARSGSGIDSGLYAQSRSEAVYAHIAAGVDALAGAGEWAIVDATLLSAARRAVMREHARALGVACVTVHCRAPIDVLEARISKRQAQATDPSEASVEVLRAQLTHFEVPTREEGDLITLDTDQGVDPAEIAQRIRTLLGDDQA
jgi:aminoglycoside phosphotransferase family enzyme/predicted kinase